MPRPDLMDIDEAAKLFRLHPVTIRKKLAAGEWPSTRIGRKTYFTDEQIAEILALSERPAIRTA